MIAAEKLNFNLPSPQPNPCVPQNASWFTYGCSVLCSTAQKIGAFRAQQPPPPSIPQEIQAPTQEQRQVKKLEKPFVHHVIDACDKKIYLTIFPLLTLGFLFFNTLTFIVLCAGALWLTAQTVLQVALHVIGDSDSRCARIFQYAHMLMREVNAVVTAAFLSPFTLCAQFHKPVGDPNGQPILLINGYGSFGSTWHYQRKWLVKKGLGPIYTMNVGSLRSIETYAKRMKKVVKTIQKETGRTDLILIGHSKGGLVSCCYATRYAHKNHANITDVITIGTPFSGTSAAKLAVGLDARQMQPSHSFLQRLQQDIEAHPEIRLFNIASKTDLIVPWKSAIATKDPNRQKVFSDLGHLSLIFSPKTADQISAWLQRDKKSSA